MKRCFQIAIFALLLVCHSYHVVAQNSPSYALSSKRTIFIQTTVDAHAEQEDLAKPDVVLSIMSEIGKKMPLVPTSPLEKTDSQSLKKKVAAENTSNIIKTIQTEAEKKYPLYKIGDRLTVDYFAGGRHYSVKGTLVQITKKSITVDDKKINIIDLDLEERSKFDPEANKAARSSYIARQSQFERQLMQTQEKASISKIKAEIFKRNESAGYIYNSKTDHWETAQDVTKRYISERIKQRSDQKKEKLAQQKAQEENSSEDINSKQIQEDNDHVNESTPSTITADEPFKNEKGEISTDGIGVGATRQDALHDAMKNAIEKAVGMYVRNKTTLQDKELKQQIIISSDATVANYKEVESFERNGMWMIKIQAKILPNELLQYAPQLKGESVSPVEIGNIINNLNSLKSASSSLEDVFDNFGSRMVKIKKNKMSLSQNLNLEDDKVSLRIQYSATFDNIEYEKFQRSFESLVAKIARQKTSLTYNNGTNKSTLKDKLSSLENTLIKKAGLNSLDKDQYSFIGFSNAASTSSSLTVYLVPVKFWKMVREIILDNKAYMIFSFTINDKAEPERCFFNTSIDWYDSAFVGLLSGYSGYPDTYVFRNTFRIDNKAIPFSDYEEVSMHIDSVKNINEIYIYLIFTSYNKRLQKAKEIEDSLF